MKKSGEAQVVDFFSKCLSDKLTQKFGTNFKHVSGNFSGSQDRKFADYFAGTGSHNILIEFKEFKDEYRAEVRKPLRAKLCQMLSSEIAILSRKCHFIGWKQVHADMHVTLNSYIDLVCQLWEAKFLVQTDDSNHKQFLQGFLAGDSGVGIDEFVEYVGHLNNLAGGTADGSTAPFHALLYSRNDEGDLVATRFENLEQMRELIGMRPQPNPQHLSKNNNDPDENNKGPTFNF